MGLPDGRRSEPVEVLLAGLHRVDHQFVSGVEGEEDELQHASRRINAEQEPAARVVLVLEGLAQECVLTRVEDDVVGEAVALVVLAG